MTRLLLLTAAALLPAAPMQAENGVTTFDGVKVRYCTNKEGNCRFGLKSKDARLVFDATAREIRIDSSEQAATFRFDEIESVVFDTTTHQRGGAAALFGLVGNAIANKTVNDYWFYVRGRQGTYRVLEIPHADSERVMAEARAALGERVTVFSTLTGTDTPNEELGLDLKAKHRIHVNKKRQPPPEVRPDKALIVVASPIMGQFAGGQKFYANDKLLAINMTGTYGAVYLDPAQYHFRTLGHKKSSGIRLRVEAGKAYYFMQNQVRGVTQTLTLQSPEVVRHEMTGLLRSEWTNK